MAEVSALVEARTGAAPAWARTDEERAALAASVDSLLDARVGMDEAVAIAFLNSPAIQADLEELGIARAAFLSAVLPPNPVLEVIRAARGNELEVEVSVSLLELLFWPQRVKAGEAGMDAAKAHAARRLADAAADVRVAYVDYVAARQALDLYEQAESAGEAAQLAAQAIYAAGNIARVDLDRQRQFAARMTAERMHAQGRIGPARQHLIAMLGLDERQAGRLQTLSRLPAPPGAMIDADLAAEAAVTGSFSIAAAEARLREVASRRGIRNVEALLGDVELIGEFERQGRWSEAYGLGFALPLDLGAAGRLRAGAEFRQAWSQLQQARLDSLTASRAAAMRAEGARELALFHRDVSLRISAEVFDGVVRDFNAMQIGMFDLLLARRDRVEAGRDYVQAVAEYWRARAELERYVRVADIPASRARAEPRQAPASASAPADHDHSHQHEGHVH
ncbi:MAG: TolC family protein [Oceanicaulis sp.]|nr:TolC family protein [Oceanicaulis sp.]